MNTPADLSVACLIIEEEFIVTGNDCEIFSLFLIHDLVKSELN